MADQETQTYSTHRRYVPLYHFVLATILLVNIIVACVQIFRSPGLWSIWALVMALALAVFFYYVRAFPLAAQNRLIRLEERLRLERLLPPGRHAEIDRLSTGQLVGLRFASDEELPGLVQATLSEDLSGEQIKKRIKTWRPDTCRV